MSVLSEAEDDDADDAEPDDDGDDDVVGIGDVADVVESAPDVSPVSAGTIDSSADEHASGSPVASTVSTTRRILDATTLAQDRKPTARDRECRAQRATRSRTRAGCGRTVCGPARYGFPHTIPRA